MFPNPCLLLATLLGKLHYQGQVSKEQADCTKGPAVKRREWVRGGGGTIYLYSQPPPGLLALHV